MRASRHPVLQDPCFTGPGVDSHWVAKARRYAGRASPRSRESARRAFASSGDRLGWALARCSGSRPFLKGPDRLLGRWESGRRDAGTGARVRSAHGTKQGGPRRVGSSAQCPADTRTPNPLPPSGERSKAVMVVVFVAALLVKPVVELSKAPAGIRHGDERFAPEFDMERKRSAKQERKIVRH